MEQWLQKPIHKKIHTIKYPTIAFPPSTPHLHLPPIYKCIPCSSFSYIIVKSSWKYYQLFYLQFPQNILDNNTPDTFSTYNLKSKIVLECQFYDMIVLEQKYVVIWYGKNKNQNGLFIIWSLSSNEAFQFSSQHLYSRKNNTQIKLFSFSQSNLFCFCQKLVQFPGEKYVIRLTYYRIAQNLSKMEEIQQTDSDKRLQIIKKFEYKFEEKSMQKQIQIVQINNISQLGFIDKYKSQKTVEFKIYQIDLSTLQDKFTSFKFEHKIIQELQICDVVLTQIWQISPCVLYMKLQTMLNQTKYFERNEPDLDGHFRDFYQQIEYIWNYKQGNVRKPTYKINEQYYQVQFINSLRNLNRYKQIPIKNPTPLKIIYDVEDYTPFEFKKQFITLPIYLVYYVGYEQRLQYKLQFSEQEAQNVFLNNTIVYNRVYVTLDYSWRFIRNQIRQQPLMRSVALAFLIDQIFYNWDQRLVQAVTELIRQ